MQRALGRARSFSRRFSLARFDPEPTLFFFLPISYHRDGEWPLDVCAV